MSFRVLPAWFVFLKKQNAAKTLLKEQKSSYAAFRKNTTAISMRNHTNSITLLRNDEVDVLKHRGYKLLPSHLVLSGDQPGPKTRCLQDTVIFFYLPPPMKNSMEMSHVHEPVIQSLPESLILLLE